MAEPVASNYPAALDSNTSLGGDAVNLTSFVLNGAINSIVDVVPLTATITGLVNTPCYILINSEVIYAATQTATSFTGCVRGVGGTTAASHSDGSAVKVVYAAGAFNQLKRAIIATQTELGTDVAGSETDLKTRLANPGIDIHAAASKATPVDADEIGLYDSAAPTVFKKLTWANLKATFMSSLGSLIDSQTGKTTPVDADEFVLADSAASNATKKVTWANIKATLITAWGTLIAALTAKTTPADADTFLLSDSAASNASKKISWANIKSFFSSSLTISVASPTTSDITGAVNTSYFLDISGLTADRNLTLPTATAGDIVQVKITTGDDLYELIIKGAATVTINGGSAATEWSRLFITGENVRFMATSATNWEVVVDRRIRSLAVFHRTGSDTGTTHTAQHTVLPDWNSLAVDRGNCGDLTNERFNCRRAGYYRPSGGGGFGSITDQKYGNIQVWKNGVITAGAVSAGTKISNSSNRQSAASPSSIIGVSLAPVPVLCATDDNLVYFFNTEEANVPLLRSDFPTTEVLAYSTFFSVEEVF